MTVINIKKHLKILGVSKLKEKQKEIINNVLSKRDVIGILPTGYGKSMCYILPHLIYNKNVIVISPLISLMSDQHSKLVEKNIFTINFNSSNKINLFDLNKIKNKELSGIFYFSPESFLSNESFIKDILNNTCLISIDECHCITTWNDFRSSYTKLNLIKKWIKESNEKIPVLALSATATKDTINKIYKKLNLKNAVLITTSFFKSNLSISIKEKEGLKSDLIQITKLINDCENKSIIYCKTQKETVELSDKLNSSNIKSVYYHGGMSSKTRETSQKKFSEDKVDVIIATIAFGMGIDISNIGLIIHYGISKDIESYYQEIGRAGRDGNEAKCVLFWRKKDFTLNRHFLGDMKSEISQNEQLSKIITIEKFIFSNECRMKYILKYFGEEFEKCNKCDNCLKNKITTKLSSIGTYYTYVILKTYKELGYGCGSNTVESILFGSKSKKVNSKMRSLSTYGILKKKSKSDDIPNKVRKLLYENLLDEKKNEQL